MYVTLKCDRIQSRVPCHIENVGYTVHVELLQVVGVPLGAQVQKVKDLGGRVHLAEDQEYLLVDEGLEVLKVLVELLLKPDAYAL